LRQSLTCIAPRCRALRANLRLLLIRACPRRLTLRAACVSLPSGCPAAWFLQPAQASGSRPSQGLDSPCGLPCGNVDSLVPTRLIRRFSQHAPPTELPFGSLSRPTPRSRFTLRAALRQSLTCIAPDAAPFGPTSGCSSFSPPRLPVLGAPQRLDSRAAAHAAWVRAAAPPPGSPPRYAR
jgi:hypothetical protein